MKLIGLSLLMGCCLTINAQPIVSVRIDKIQIGGDAPIYDYTKMPDVLGLGLYSASTNYISTDYHLSPGNSRFQISRQKRKTLADSTDFIINGSITYSKGSVYDFEIVDAATNKHYGIGVVFDNQGENYLKPLSDVASGIRNKITEVLSRRNPAKFNCGIKAEVRRGQNLLDDISVSELLRDFSRNWSSQLSSIMVPWDTMRNFSFNKEKADKIFRLKPLDMIIEAEFEYDKESNIIIQPNLFIKDNPGEIKLNQIILSNDRSVKEFYAPIEKDLNELFQFIRPNGTDIDRHNLGFLEYSKRKKVQELLDSARYFMFAGQDFKALFLARSAVEIDPTNPQGYLTIANIRYAQGRYDEALNSLDQFKSLNPPKQSLAYYHIYKGLILQEDEKNDTKALHSFRMAYRIDSSYNAQGIEINFLLGKTYARLSKFDSAILFLNKSIRADKSNETQSIYWIGFCQYYTKNYIACIEVLSKIYALDGITKNPDFPHLKSYLGSSYLELCKKELIKKNYPKAEELIKKSIEYEEDFVTNYFLMFTYDCQKDFTKCRSLISAKKEAKFFGGDIYGLRGDLLRALFYENKLDASFAHEAIYSLKENLALHPSDSLSMYDVGNIYLSLNQLDSGIYFLSQSMKFGYINYVSFLDLAEAYIKSGEANKVNALLSKIPIHASDEELNKRNEMLKLYLKLLANKILLINDGNTAREFEKKINQYKRRNETKIITGWSYDSLIAWTKDPKNKLSRENKDFILKRTEEMQNISELQ